MSNFELAEASEMKVHPGMLMKTRGGGVRCQVAGVKCMQASAHYRLANLGAQGWDKMSRSGLAGTSKMKVHPGMLMKIRESRFQVPGGDWIPWCGRYPLEVIAAGLPIPSVGELVPMPSEAGIPQDSENWGKMSVAEFPGCRYQQPH